MKDLQLVPLFIFTFFSLFLETSFAGLNKFTYLDKVKMWVIERKFDPKTNQISCRAFIPKQGTWFSSRIRLDKDGDLIEPFQLKNKLFKSEETIREVQEVLKQCRQSGLIYVR